MSVYNRAWNNTTMLPFVHLAHVENPPKLRELQEGG